MSNMDTIEEKKKQPISAEVAEQAVNDEAAAERGQAVTINDGEPEKAYYSKTSVWLMILFSGLAIGSDG